MMNKAVCFIILNILFKFIYSITSSLGVLKTPIIRINNTYYNLIGLRNLKTINNSPQDLKVYGGFNILNYYYTNLYIGKEKKKQSYIIDTGSGITSSVCLPYCKNCGKHLNSDYYLANTSELLNCGSDDCSMVNNDCEKNSKDSCGFSISYTEGSTIKGIFYKELVYFGDDFDDHIKDNKNSSSNSNSDSKPHIKHKLRGGVAIPIGCTTYENNLFLTQLADGILGLMNGNENLPTIIYKKGGIKQNIFSLCLGVKGGYFSLGEINTRYHKEKIFYTDMLKRTHYKIRLTSVKVQSRGYFNIRSNNEAMIDSGTTISYFPRYLGNHIINEINSYCSEIATEKENLPCGKYEKSHSGPCFKFNSVDDLNYAVNNKWPNITIKIGSYSFVWEPKNYMFNSTSGDEILACLGFEIEGSSDITLGSSFMIGHDFIFDRINNKIGIARADCNKESANITGMEDFNINEIIDEDSTDSIQGDDKNTDNYKTKAIIFGFIALCAIIAVFVIYYFCFYKKNRSFWCCKSRKIVMVEEEFNEPKPINDNPKNNRKKLGLELELTENEKDVILNY